MVDIIIGGAISPVQNDPKHSNNVRWQAPKKKAVRNRRKARKDRRNSVRNGVTVTLSMYPDRRCRRDRRK